MPTSQVLLQWTGQGLYFRGGAPDRPQASVDGDSKRAASPVDMLLLSLAGCMGADVVDILGKSRVELDGLEIEVVGERAEEHPRRLSGLRIVFRLTGPASTDKAKVQRAVDLSRDKYCTVLHSLRLDLDLEIEIEVT